MLEFIKCATGPDLSNYVKKCKNISNMPQNICENAATGPDLWNYVKKCWNI